MKKMNRRNDEAAQAHAEFTKGCGAGMKPTHVTKEMPKMMPKKKMPGRMPMKMGGKGK